MNRLTTKIKGVNKYCEFELKNAKYKDLFELSSNREIENYVNADLTIAIDKLGQLEDIEEELGIDLITLFDIYNKMAKQKYVYIKYIDIGKVVKDDLHNGYFVINFKKKEIEEIYYEPCNWYEFKNYGKTWALTREELENE